MRINIAGSEYEAASDSVEVLCEKYSMLSNAITHPESINICIKDDFVRKVSTLALYTYIDNTCTPVDDSLHNSGSKSRRHSVQHATANQTQL
jgi:hypothetical protein